MTLLFSARESAKVAALHLHGIWSSGMFKKQKKESIHVGNCMTAVMDNDRLLY